MVTIEYLIPYEELIRKNGIKPCLEIVPGTRKYLTYDKHYGKENAYAKEKV
jgi:hypothetical protein